MKHAKGLSVADPAYCIAVAATKNVVKELRAKYGVKAKHEEEQTEVTLYACHGVIKAYIADGTDSRPNAADPVIVWNQPLSHS